MTIEWSIDTNRVSAKAKVGGPDNRRHGNSRKKAQEAQEKESPSESFAIFRGHYPS
jgi:hypothetical protein